MLWRRAWTVKSRPLLRRTSNQSMVHTDLWKWKGCHCNWPLPSQLRHGNIPDQPDQTFCGNVLAGLQFVQDKGLQGLRLRRGCLLTLTDFLGGVLEYVDTGDITYWTNLDVAEQVILDRGEGGRTEDVYEVPALV